MFKKIILLLFVVLINIEVNAACSTEEFNILKEKAKKVEFSYDYELEKISDYLQEDSIYAFYTLTAYNLDSNLLVQTETSYGAVRTFKYNKNQVSSLSNFSGGRITITIRGNTKTCNSVFKTEIIDLLYYNNLYESETCREYPLFKYCQNQFEKFDVLGIDIYTELNKYKEKLENENNDEIDDEKEKSFLEEHFVAIGVISLVVIVLVSLTVIRIRIIVKRRSL